MPFWLGFRVLDGVRRGIEGLSGAESGGIDICLLKADGLLDDVSTAFPLEAEGTLALEFDRLEIFFGLGTNADESSLLTTDLLRGPSFVGLSIDPELESEGRLILRILLGGLGGSLGGRSLEPTLDASEGARRDLATGSEDWRGARDGRFCCDGPDGTVLSLLSEISEGGSVEVFVALGIPEDELPVLLTDFDVCRGGKVGRFCDVGGGTGDTGLFVIPS